MNASSASEGDGSVTFNVSVEFPGSVVLTTDTNVTISIANGTAVSGADFDVVSDFNVTIPAGSLNGSETFSLSVVDDNIFEGSETLSVGGTAASLTVNPSSVTVTIQDNDAEPTQIILTSDPTSVNENSGATTINVSASFPGTIALTENVTATISIANGTAVSGADFDVVSDFNVTIPAGSLSGSETFSLNVVNDLLAEGPEAFSIGGSASGFTVQSASLNIVDNDVASSSVDLSLDVSSVSEGDGSVTFNVSVGFPGSVVLTTDTDVTISIANGTAVSGADFGVVSDFNVTIPAGNLSGSETFSLSVVDDSIFEGSETLSVSGSATGLTVNPSSVTVTIQDNDAKPTQIVLTSDPTNVNENGGTTTINVSASFPGTITLTENVTVTVSILDGTAVSGDEFDSVSDFNVVIPAGSLNGSETFSLTVNDNNVLENDKTLSISGTASSFTINAITLTINEDDVQPTTITLNVTPANVDETSNTTVLTVSARFPDNSTVLIQDTNVTVNVSGLNATAGTNFLAVPDFNLTIPALGTEGSATFSLTVIDNKFADDTVALRINGTAQTFTVNPVTLTINNNDVIPTTANLRISPNSVSEAVNTTIVTVYADFPENSSVLLNDMNVTVSVDGDSATEGSDFTSTPSDFNVTIRAGQTNGSSNFSLNLIDDTIDEGNEILSVNGISGMLNVTPANFTILENDVAPTTINLKVNPDTVDEDDGRTTIKVTASFANGNVPLPENTDVSVTVSSGSASENADFSKVSSFTITIPANQTTASTSFSLRPIDDNSYEDDETIRVRGDATGFKVNSATITLIEDDNPPPQAAQRWLPATSTDYSSTQRAVQVVRSASPGESIAVDLSDRNVIVTAVNMYLKDRVNLGGVVITHLDPEKTAQSESLQGKTYQLLSINTTANLNRAVEQANVTFLVSKTWLSSNDFEPTEISVQSYQPTSKTWTRARVRLLRQTSNHAYYSFEKPQDSSIFAVTASASEETLTPPQEEPPTPRPPEPRQERPPEPPQEPPEDMPEEPSEPSAFAKQSNRENIGRAIVASIIILAIIAFLVILKHSRKKKNYDFEKITRQNQRMQRKKSTPA